MARGTLILKDCDIVSYPSSNYGPSNLLFRFNNSWKVLDLKSLWKSMKLWELLIAAIKMGVFFYRSLLKAVRNSQIEQMKNWKLAILTVRQIKFKSLLNFIFAMTAKTNSKLRISISIKVSNFLNLAEICRENAFSCNFYKIFKGLSFHCQKTLDLKSLWKCRNILELLIFVMKTGRFFIRSLASG